METVAGSLVQPLMTVIKDPLKYVLFYGTYIKDLRKGLILLKDARKRVQEQVDSAECNAEDIHDDVKTWLEDVDEITKQAEDIIEKHENSKKDCFHRVVVPNPSTRLRIAKKAEENKQEIEKLQQRLNFQSMSHPKAPLGIVAGNYRGPQYWIAPSRAALLKDISKALLDPNNRMVVIYGASGVGKSVLLKQLEKQVQERKLSYDFDAVTMAAVSRSPNC